MRPVVVTTSSWPAAVVGGRPVEAQQADRGAGERAARRPAPCTGSASGVGSSDREEVVDVDRLHGEPAAHDVVAGAHQLDAGAAEVGVEVPGPRWIASPGASSTRLSSSVAATLGSPG